MSNDQRKTQSKAAKDAKKNTYENPHRRSGLELLIFSDSNREERKKLEAIYDKTWEATRKG